MSQEARQASDGLAQAGEAAIATVRRIARENGAEDGDFTVVAMDAATRRVALDLKVGLGWKSAGTQTVGAVDPPGSTRASSVDSALDHVEKAGSTAAKSEAVAEGFAETIRRSPLEAFRSIQDTVPVQDVRPSFHGHVRCDGCGGHGEHGCNGLMCVGGQVTCPRCRGDGRETCNACHGSGSEYVQVQVRTQNGWNWQSSRQLCRRCGGQGKAGFCVNCSGHKEVPCPICGGSAVLTCKPCQGCGWFTKRFSANVIGTATKAWAFQASAPAAFATAVKSIGMNTFPGTYAVVESTAVTAGTGSVSLRITCQVPHVWIDMLCGRVRIELDAIGPEGRIPVMPAFLDELLDDTLLEINNPRTTMADLRAATSRARLSRELMAAVVAGKKIDAKTVSDEHSGAASERFVVTMHGAIKNALHRQTASAVRNPWLVAAPLSCGIAAASALVAAPPWLPPSVSWMAAPLFIVATWLWVGNTGRRLVRGEEGQRVKWRPKQAWWFWGTMAAALALQAAIAMKRSYIVATPLANAASHSLATPAFGTPTLATPTRAVPNDPDHGHRKQTH